MDYKKKYKEALSWIKDVYPTFEGAVKEDAEHFFPELKESEDERIRKRLIEEMRHFQREAAKESCDADFDFAKSAIAWLEKQGRYKFEHGDDNATKVYKNEDGTKKEPKFKVGDFIVSDYCMGKVIALTDDAYLLDTEQGIPFSCEHNAHLWTIQDAKDGDVLQFDCGVGIFKNLSADGYNAHCYCYYDRNGQLETNDYSLYDIYEATPATKKQCDLLFQKVKEAGYEWDAEKKGLKKISQEYPLTPDECINPAWTWSKEDEISLGDALWAIEQARTIAKDENDMGNLWYAEKWLKSLKERVQPQWKPSEEQMKGIDCAIKTLRHQLNVEDKRLNSLYEQLKKL